MELRLLEAWRVLVQYSDPSSSKNKSHSSTALFWGGALAEGSLGLRNALGLAEAGIAMMDNQIIIGEGRKREREGHEVGRHLPVDSIDPEQPRRP